MIARRIFKKKKFNIKFFLFLLFIFLFLIIFIYFFFVNKTNIFIIIPENKEIFYNIPKDKGGEKVPNLDKKSLNIKSQQIILNNLIKKEDLLFSIQFYTDSDYKKVNKFLEKITNSNETIYNVNDFYILTFKSGIGIEYFLLYKNFTTRKEANNYCVNFLPKIENCFVVDTSKF